MNDMNDWPECEEFYNLMQAYRHTPFEHQKEVVAAYEAVKDWIRKHAVEKEDYPPSEILD